MNPQKLAFPLAASLGSLFCADPTRRKIEGENPQNSKDRSSPSSVKGAVLAALRPIIRDQDPEIKKAAYHALRNIGKKSKESSCLLTESQINAIPIGSDSLQYKINDFDCNQFSQAFILYLKNVHGLEPGKSSWQVVLKVYKKTWGGLFEKWTAGHALNLVRLPLRRGDPPGSEKFAMVEPTNCGRKDPHYTAILFTWFQPKGTPPDLERVKSKVDRLVKAAKESTGGYRVGYEVVGNVENVEPGAIDVRNHPQTRNLWWIKQHQPMGY